MAMPGAGYVINCCDVQDDDVSYSDIHYYQFWLIKELFETTEWEEFFNIANGFSKIGWRRLSVDTPIRKTIDFDKPIEVIELTAKIIEYDTATINVLFDDDGRPYPNWEPSYEEDVINAMYKLLVECKNGFCCCSHTISRLEHNKRFELLERCITISGPTVVHKNRMWKQIGEAVDCRYHSLKESERKSRWREVPDGKMFLFDKAPDEELFKETLLNEKLSEEIIQWDLQKGMR